MFHVQAYGAELQNASILQKPYQYGYTLISSHDSFAEAREAKEDYLNCFMVIVNKTDLSKGKLREFVKNSKDLECDIFNHSFGDHIEIDMHAYDPVMYVYFTGSTCEEKPNF